MGTPTIAFSPSRTQSKRYVHVSMLCILTGRGVLMFRVSLISVVLKMGSVGILTGGLIDRSAYYTHALIMALIPFVPANQWLYSPETSPAAVNATVTMNGAT